MTEVFCRLRCKERELGAATGTNMYVHTCVTYSGSAMFSFLVGAVVGFK
jgi:hypothetical protein